MANTVPDLKKKKKEEIDFLWQLPNLRYLLAKVNQLETTGYIHSNINIAAGIKN